MKRTIILTLSIFVLCTAALGENNFRIGNEFYLGRKYQDALDQYQQFIQKKSDYYEGYFNAGNALFRQEQYDGALNMYKKAQEINPKDPDIQYNIDLTEKKMQEKQKQNKNSKDKNQKGDQNKQQSQQGQNKQGQNGQQQQGQQQQGKQGQGQQAGQQPGTGNKQPPSGMTADEVQALLNQKQDQEKQLKGYFGKQYNKNSQEPDMFNMSPQEMMRYMQQRMMDPFNQQQPPQKSGQGQQKDW